MNAVSAYTDRQAIEDGYLIDVTSLKLDFRGTPVTRVTSACWEDRESQRFAELFSAAPAMLSALEAMLPLARACWERDSGIDCAHPTCAAVKQARAAIALARGVKRCVKCDTALIDPQLAPAEREVCAKCSWEPGSLTDAEIEALRRAGEFEAIHGEQS